MINLFFNSDKQFDEVAILIFTSLGIENYLEGESSNVLGGYYFSYNVFGIEIKLEQNSYDYEGQFNHMIHIKENSMHSLKIDSSIENMVAGIVLKLLCNNLNVQLAIEKGNELLMVSQDNIFEVTQ